MSVLLVFGLNIFCFFVLELAKLFFVDGRAEMLCFKEKNISRKIFKELNKLETNYNSYEGWRRKPHLSETINIDSNGVRFNPKITNITTDAKNVYFFGGSTIWGTGVDDQNTVSELWRLKNIHSLKNVFNYGESGFDSRQSLETVINLLSNEKKIDVAIFYVGVNELNRCRKVINTNQHIYQYKFNDIIQNNDSFFYWIFYKYSKVFFLKLCNKFAPENENDIYQLQCDCNPKKLEGVVNNLYFNLETARYLIEKQQGKFYAFLQPVIYVGKPKKNYIEKTLFYSKKEEKNYVALYDKILIKNNGQLHNLTNSLNIDSSLYFDFCHINNLGNKIISQKIDSIIKFN